MELDGSPSLAPERQGVGAGSPDRRVRIGLLVDGHRRLAPWEQRLVDRIFASPRLELCLRIESNAAQVNVSSACLQSRWLALEARFAARPHPFEMDSPGGKHFEALPRFQPTDEAAVGLCELDIILDLSGSCGTGFPARLARHGIWFTGLSHSGIPFAGLRAVAAREPVSEIAVWRRVGPEQLPVQVASASLNTKFIAARNGLFMAEKSVTLLVRELERLSCMGYPAEYAGAAFTPPGPVSTLRFASYLLGLCGEIVRRMTEIALTRMRFRPGMFVLRTGKGDPRRFVPAESVEHAFPDNAYQADPFLWEVNHKLYCFFETYDFRTGKGHISVGRFEGERLVDIRTAVQAGYHLSFPFLYEADGELYMMPETCGARRIELWRCVSFPDRWQRHAVVMDDVIAADSSVARINGEWWLFTNISKDPFQEMNSELHVFRADGPKLTSLQPHPLNPVVFDTRTARNGGRILEIEGKFYRPSQDNSHGTYGYGLNLMRIDELNMTAYSETPRRKFEPDFARGLIGCHHLDMRAGRIIIDVRKRIGGLATRVSAIRNASNADAGPPRPDMLQTSHTQAR